jgi:hypothetical protein
MPLVSVIIIIALIGVIVWAVTKYIPMDPNFKTLIVILSIVVVVVWLLSLTGLLPDLNAIKVGG